MKKVIITLLIIVLLVGGGFFAIKALHTPKETIREPKGDTPKATEKYKKEAVIDNPNSESNEKTEIKYDQYITASGYAGASDNVYYTRNNTLYHLTLSTNTSEVIAEGVSKIEEDIDTILVYKNSDFKQVKEDNYLTYID